MNAFLSTFRRVGFTLLTTAATAMIVIGVADAQNPNKKCVAPTKSGCAPADCYSPTGQCNSKNDYDGQERSAYSYRLCNGDVDNCDNWNQNYLVCENRFYTRGAQGNCTTKECTLKTEISACSP
jgi:hypothetical protein